jgi:uncharacterized membrane protein
MENTNKRLFPLDALRGLIMILMALDHANHFVAQRHPSGEYWAGPFPFYVSAQPFLTRFVTHLAAPGFFFLMGAGMILFARSRQRADWSRWRIRRFFWIRGTLLIALQLLVINRAWELSPGGWLLDIYIGVLFALGGAMILSSFLLWLQPHYLLLSSVILVISTELLLPDPRMWTQILEVPRMLLSVPGGSPAFWVNYPILPWLGLVTFGMAFGHWLHEDNNAAYSRALKVGGVLLLVFILVRSFNGFGNISPRAGDRWIDFLNVVKYPPGITFISLTMGINLVLLWAFSTLSERYQRFFIPFVIYGQVPLFFYLAHLFLYAALGNLMTPQGTSYAIMYLYWLVGLLILYPFCLWYGQLKRKAPIGSLLRFF